jgi:hypothetical protein
MIMNIKYISKFNIKSVLKEYRYLTDTYFVMNIK